MTPKTVIIDLPEKNEMKAFCSLTKEQASLYAAVRVEFVSARNIMCRSTDWRDANQPNANYASVNILPLFYG